MIYLIGGPPKCGKTTLAKYMLREHGIPWVSTDALECIAGAYIDPAKRPAALPHAYMKGENNDETYAEYTAEEIMQGYIEQSAIAHEAIRMFALSENAEQNDFVIEGYHVTPTIANALSIELPDSIKTIFLVRTNSAQLAKDFHLSTTQNDWILRKTHKQETFSKIAEMLCMYGTWFEGEAKKYDLPIQNMDKNFSDALKQASTLLIRS
jgi:2-phosphoglycerate kinase